MEFFTLVKEMRETQKSYLRTGKVNVLNKAKDLGRRVDNEIEAIQFLFEQETTSEETATKGESQ